METAKRPVPQNVAIFRALLVGPEERARWALTLHHHGDLVKERTVHSLAEAIRQSKRLLTIAKTLLEILASPIVGIISFCIAFGSRLIRGLQRLNHEDHVTDAWLRQYRGREHER